MNVSSHRKWISILAVTCVFMSLSLCGRLAEVIPSYTWAVVTQYHLYVSHSSPESTFCVFSPSLDGGIREWHPGVIPRKALFSLHLADGLLTAAKGIRIDMFTLKNNVGFKWHRLHPIWLCMYENVLIALSTNLKWEISTGCHISIGLLSVRAANGRPSEHSWMWN